MKKCLFYGSLRKNGPREKTYNFNRFGGQTYVKTLKIKGFDLYNLGSFPCITEGNGEITCELHNVENESARQIFWMEAGAGYKSKEIKIDGENAIIFYYPEKPQGKDQKLIQSGDWCNS